MLDKVGARRWIARIMLTWGLVSGARPSSREIAAATGFSGEHTFYLLRVLLGFAEAGFFPGIIFFLTLWFPASHRARIIGYFMAAIPLSSALGSPVSAALLGLDGAPAARAGNGCSSSRPLPSLVLAFVTFFYLTDRPADATLARARQSAPGCSAASRSRTSGASTFRPRARSRASTTRACSALSLVYFGAVACTLRRRLLAADDRQGLRRFDRADRLDQRHPLCRRLLRHDLVGPALGPHGGADDASRDRAGARRDRHRRLGVPRPIPLLKMIALTIGAFGVFASLPIFWTLPTAFLAGAAARRASRRSIRSAISPAISARSRSAGSRTRPAAFAWGLVGDRRLRGGRARHHAGVRPRSPAREGPRKSENCDNNPSANAEQIAYWNSVAARRWLDLDAKQDVVFAPITAALFDAPGSRRASAFIDVGCGGGGTTIDIARRVGAAGARSASTFRAPMLARRASGRRDGRRSNSSSPTPRPMLRAGVVRRAVLALRRDVLRRSGRAPSPICAGALGARRPSRIRLLARRPNSTPGR